MQHVEQWNPDTFTTEIPCLIVSLVETPSSAVQVQAKLLGGSRVYGLWYKQSAFYSGSYKVLEQGAVFLEDLSVRSISNLMLSKNASTAAQENPYFYH